MNKDKAIQAPVDFLTEISNFIFTNKYARYNEHVERRETWDECVDRVETMHINKFRKKLGKEDMEEMKWALQKVREQLVIPSMRSMQYAGKAMEVNNTRGYNCAVRYVDSIRSFAEIQFGLLSGAGLGCGLFKPYLDRLPDLVSAEDKTGTVLTYVIEDTLEGWADCIEALLMCYFRNTAYTGRKIVFDYSKIRKAGAPLKTSGGKAPGHKGLKLALSKIKELLDYIIEEKGQTRLKSINAYDIICHGSDAVLSGGLRRAALLALFDYDDKDMLDAKTYFTVSKCNKFHLDEDTGKYYGRVTFNKKKYDLEGLDKFEVELLEKENKLFWKHIEPQRARANNSVLFERETVTKEQFQDIIERTKQYGEPSFCFGKKSSCLNPCTLISSNICTEQGIKQIKDLKIGEKIWSKSGWTTVTNIIDQGIKPTFEYRTTAGSFHGTENHHLVSNSVKTEAKDCKTIDRLAGPTLENVLIDLQTVVDGLVMGDGCKADVDSYTPITLCIGEDDQDYFQSEIAPFIGLNISKSAGYTYTRHQVYTTLKDHELDYTYNRSIPKRFFETYSSMASFLRGLYTANGSIVGGLRVTLKTASPVLRDDVQLMLSALGIRSYYTTNKPTEVEFSNGTYLCKESYDVNISSDADIFAKNIGFIQKYKTDKLAGILKGKKKVNKKSSFEVKSITPLGDEHVCDITVDNDSHTFWCDGLNISNCGEVGFMPITVDGVCGVQFCNLTSINGAKIISKEAFLEAVKAATILGTVQASYTDFKYLSTASKKLTEEEALLGVSITGFMDNPDILLNPEIQKEAAEYACQTNELWAKKIGINPAARVTVVKPEGTSSLVLKTASGIHPHHARRYFRRVQCNKLDPVYKYFKSVNPHMVEESIWSASKTDDVITFPLTVPDKAMVKADLTAIKHLEIIKSTYENWIRPGTSKYNKKPITHNISCTVIVKDEEWNEVIDYIFNNRYSFCAVSFLPYIGDKLYKQAPLEAVVTEEDEKKWVELISKYKAVDYRKLKEMADNTAHSGEVACAGGACEIV